MSLVTDANMDVVSEARYMPYGEVRWAENASPTDYAFTGQRAEGFGLMDFNARFFSPRLGRFVSADSIVPNPASAIDFDRYMYAAGNPLRYIDPSGHGYCHSEYAEQDICDELADPDTGDILAPVKLTEDLDFCNGDSCYDGSMMWELYLEYLEMPGWWNNYGKHRITVKEFLILIMYGELGGQADKDPKAVEAFQMALNKKLLYWCEQYSTRGGSCDYISDNAILNYIATRGSAWKRYDEYVIYDKPINPGQDLPWDYDTASNVVEGALVIGGSGALWDWGSVEYFFPKNNWKHIREALIGPGYDQVLWISLDGVTVVMTDKQISYWKSPR